MENENAFYKSQLKTMKWHSFRNKFILFSWILVVVVVVSSIYNTYADFIDQYGLWGFLLALFYEYPPLVYLSPLSNAPYAPGLIIQTYYFFLNITPVNEPLPVAAIMGTGSSPYTNPTGTDPTLLQILYQAPTVTNWNEMLQLVVGGQCSATIACPYGQTCGSNNICNSGYQDTDIYHAFSQYIHPVEPITPILSTITKYLPLINTAIMILMLIPK